MENRIEELSKLVVEQALQLAELHRVAVETTSQSTLLQVAKLDIFNLTEEIRVLKQQVRKKVRTIDNYKKQLTVEAKESNGLRASNYELRRKVEKFQTAYDWGVIELQGRITEVSDLTKKNDKLKKSENFLIEENARLNAKIAELESGVIVGEDECKRGRTKNDKRWVAVISLYRKHFDEYVAHQNVLGLGDNTTYVHIDHISQLDDRRGYNEIVRENGWRYVSNKSFKINTPDGEFAFEKHLDKKTYES